MPLICQAHNKIYLKKVNLIPRTYCADSEGAELGSGAAVEGAVVLVVGARIVISLECLI